MEHKSIFCLELIVRNHSGVMAHITGLFSRRNFNLEGILCAPLRDEEKSCVYLFVRETGRMEQTIKQLLKLYDVVSVRMRMDRNQYFFHDLRKLVRRHAKFLHGRNFAGESVSKEKESIKGFHPVFSGKTPEDVLKKNKKVV